MSFFSHRKIVVVVGFYILLSVYRNHFRQSYMMQFHKIMSPIFARLGVKLITRNVGMGGLGTIQNGLGSKSIYGNEIDLLIWDSGKYCTTFNFFPNYEGTPLLSLPFLLPCVLMPFVSSPSSAIIFFSTEMNNILYAQA